MDLFSAEVLGAVIMSYVQWKERQLFLSYHGKNVAMELCRSESLSSC